MNDTERRRTYLAAESRACRLAMQTRSPYRYDRARTLARLFWQRSRGIHTPEPLSDIEIYAALKEREDGI